LDWIWQTELDWSWNPSYGHSHCTFAWHVQKFKFLAKMKTTSTGKLLDSLPLNDAVAELWFGKFNLAECRDL
jgi:hypothetical protein